MTPIIDYECPIGFASSSTAHFIDIHQRMAFGFEAPAQFDEQPQRSDRHLIEQAILDIASGRGVR